MFNLKHGDCMKLLSEIPDNSIGMILTDPPYGTTPCEWDKALNLQELWPQLKRVLKQGGVAALFGTEPFSSHLRMSNIEMFKYDLYWKKSKSLGANFAHAKNAPIKIIETISIFSEFKINHKTRGTNRMTYNPQGLKPFGKVFNGQMPSKVDAFRRNIERPSHKSYLQEFTGYPSNVLEHHFENTERKNRLHPTQKPVSLLEFLINTYSEAGETVLDFTMGSGSTGVACKNTGRNFIGIERDGKYFEIAQRRINAHASVRLLSDSTIDDAKTP